MTLIGLEGVSVAFGERVVLSELSVEVPTLGSTALMGPSGSGKSTLLGVLAGRQPLTTGRRCEHVTPLRVAWIFQTAPVLPERSALDNVAIGALATGVAPHTADEEAAAALAALGLDGLAHQRAKRLSGGERQRVAIARVTVVAEDGAGGDHVGVPARTRTDEPDQHPESRVSAGAGPVPWYNAGMASSVSPSIDNLERTWRSIVELCADLTDEEWARPTGCPGWSVQDQIAHLVDYESRALGRPAPEAEVAAAPHLKNPLGEANEVGVEARRGRRGSEVLDELREVSAARLDQLRALTADELARPVDTPAGPGTLADMLTLRVMDTWSHEQDIRRALGRPGHDRGPAVDESVAYFTRFLPVVVGKRVAPPDGTVVAFAVGDVHRSAVEMVERRGRAVEGDVAQPTVRLTMPAPTFAALVGGRTDAPDDVAVEGDEALGREVVDALGFMP